MYKFFIPIFSVVILISSPTFAQKDNIDVTLRTINKLLGGRTVVTIKKEELTVEVTKNGKLFRRDQVFIHDLNAEATSYIAEELSVVLRCSRKPGACVDKRLFVHKKQDQYTRLAILIRGNEEVKDELVTNFKKLILLGQQ
ncbi:MAG: hypothetical protein JKX73_01600 [Flavobacteriales bacterium]|nr:hypothetical protein [Flavobacteriales bacterium]